MTPFRLQLVERARALDDEFDDNTCPGCGQDITGWREWDCHYPGPVHFSTSTAWRRDHIGLPWPFTSEQSGDRHCVWTRDLLMARRFRRRYIARYAEAVS